MAIGRMAAAVKKFNKEVDRFAKTLPIAVLVPFQKKIALEVLARITLRTPVDTGRARGNWIVGVGTEPSEVLERFDKTGGATSPAVQSELSKLSGLRPFSLVFITNNLPYIEALEAGHSPQSPPGGMLELTLAEIRSIFP